MKPDSGNQFTRYIYWMEEDDFNAMKESLPKEGVKLSGVMMTPCEVLRAKGNKALYASPQVWSFMCKRQGSWYRESERAGKYMVASEKKLPEKYDAFLDTEMRESDFLPESLPTAEEMEKLIDSKEYRDSKPEQWEQKGIKDAVMFKTMFTVTGFWGIGDNLNKHWLSHKANHANYLAHHFTTEVEGEKVPYSIAENAGICSSCVEMFNVIDEKSRKLVRACPGAVTFGFIKRDKYYDVNPGKKVPA